MRSIFYHSLTGFWLILAIFLSGCGYRSGVSAFSQCYKTLSIPYAKGDVHGILTEALIEQISKSGAFSYRRDGGALILDVVLLDIDEENIGFVYDFNKQGKRERSTIPTETRATATAQVQLIESSSNKVIYGPVKIEAFVEFDHNYYFGSDELNRISLGQVTDIDAARDAVCRPLFEALSRKIADNVVYYW